MIKQGIYILRMLQSLPLDASDVDPLQGSEGGEEVAVMHACNEEKNI